MPHRRALTPETFSTALLLIALATGGPAGLKAGTVTCSNGPGCLNATDSFNWATDFGAEFNSIPNQSTALSDSGALAAMIGFAGGGDGQRMDQGSGWNGNFNAGDALLWTNSPGQGPITFQFSQLLTGLGAHIQADFQGPFTAQLLAFDSQGNLIDSVSASGDSNANGDGSAIYLGLAGDAGIASATFLQTSCPCDTGDFAIGSLGVASAPEPGSFVLVFLVFPVICVAARYRSRLRKPAEAVALVEFRKGEV